MSTRPIQPTPYPDVNAVLHTLLSEVQTVLADHLIGMYLYGSLAMGDFTPNNSDIDFVVVTADEISHEIYLALAAMHVRFAANESKWATELDGSYIPQEALRRYDPADALHPHIDRGGCSLNIEQHDSDWVIQRYILREHGVVVAGPALQKLIDPIHPDELRQGTLELLHGWWAPMLDDPTPLHNLSYRFYAILTMCRILYTLQYGTIVSKPVAARWVQESLGEQWTELIKEALAWPYPWPYGGQADNLNNTLNFIKYTVEHGQ